MSIQYCSIGDKEIDVPLLQSYFQKIYNYILGSSNLPCVQVTKKAWYPMEVGTVERGNKYTKKLNQDQVAEALNVSMFLPICPFGYQLTCIIVLCSHHSASQSTTPARQRWSLLPRAHEKRDLAKVAVAMEQQQGFPLNQVQQAVTMFAQASGKFGIPFASMQPPLFHAGDTASLVHLRDPQGLSSSLE